MIQQFHFWVFHSHTSPHPAWSSLLALLAACMVPEFPGGASGEEPACQCRRCWRHGFDSWIGKISWRKAWQPIPVFTPGESHGTRSLVGCGPEGCKESDATKETQRACSGSATGELGFQLCLSLNFTSLVSPVTSAV